MVTVRQLSLEEFQQRRRHQTLVDLAKCTIEASVREIGHFTFSCYRTGIVVLHSVNQVLVYEERYFDKALSLATTFEAETGEHFVLKKEYA